MRPGETLVHPATGERITLVVESADVLVLEAVWPPGAGRTPEHAHPAMEERFVPRSGPIAVRVGGAERCVRPGEVVAVVPGTTHTAWNPGADEVTVRLEFRPPLRWRAFVSRLFAGERPGTLAREFAPEVRAA